MKILSILLFMISGNCMAEIFLEEKNDRTGRFAIIEENGTSAWLYLTPESGGGIDRDAFIYSPIEPANELNIKGIKKGETPILTKSVASDSAVRKNVKENELGFKWSSDGHSVAVIYRNEPIAFVIGTVKASYSKALSKESFFGNPWDPNIYKQTFE